jgi:hypothetical protein
MSNVRRRIGTRPRINLFRFNHSKMTETKPENEKVNAMSIGHHGGRSPDTKRHQQTDFKIFRVFFFCQTRRRLQDVKMRGG